MKNKYTKKNNGSKEFSNKNYQEKEILEADNLLERILLEERENVNNSGASGEGFEIDIIGMSSDDNSSIDELDALVDELDEDMASRLSLYESVDDDEDEDIKEFISRDYDVVVESRRRVNQPGKRKFDSEPKKEKVPKEKKEKPPKEKREKPKKEKIKVGEDGDIKPSAFRTLLNKWKAIYREKTLQILLEVLGVLTIILIVAIIVIPKGIDKKENNGSKGSKRTEDTSTKDKYTQGSTEEASTEKKLTMADLEAESEDSAIHKFIVTFMDAEKLKCDIELAKTYIDNTDKYAISEFDLLQQRYIESLSNVKCYKYDVISKDMYFVFVSYEVKYKNIETTAPRGNAYVVKYDSAQDKYFIHNILENEQADILIASNAPEIQVLTEDIIKRNNEAIAKDEVLKEFLNILQGSNSSEEKK